MNSGIGRPPNEFFSNLLERLEQELHEVSPEQLSSRARLRAQRIAMAFDIGTMTKVIQLGDDFLRTFPPTAPSFALVTTLLVRALHFTGSHEREVHEALGAARRPEVGGSDFVFLLEWLATQHGDAISAAPDLEEKLGVSISALAATTYPDLRPSAAPSNASLKERAITAANEIRAAGRAHSAAVLARESPRYGGSTT